MLKLQDGYKPGCPLPLATNVCLRGPEPNGEVEQDLMMELDYRTLHVHVEMCVCVFIYILLSLQIGPFSCMYMAFVTCLLCIYLLLYTALSVLNETDIPGTSLLLYTYSGPLSRRCYVVRCSNKVHNQEKTSACVYHQASEQVR